jgi:RNA polymerase sigma factor (sigma-70 family)
VTGLTTPAEDLLRELAPQVLGVLARRYGDFGAAEDAVQEALLAAATRWPQDGIPDNPRGWLIQAASRALTDQYRSDTARRRRELAGAAREPEPASAPVSGQDDTLVLLSLCCHPALTPASAVALTLRAVGGLTTAEIAGAFLVPEATMAQRISRAKQKIKESGLRFELPASEADQATRMSSVLHVLYLIFNEGYAATAGSRLHRVELSAEAIRLARMVHRMRPGDGEVTGLLALMLLTDARRPARTGAGGELIPLDEQDRSRWDQALIAEGTALAGEAIAGRRVGEYQLQAAIAAEHDRAASVAETDWARIAALYGLLEKLTGNPMVSLNRAIAVAMARGPQDGPAAGLALLERLSGPLAGYYRLDAVRGHLRELGGDWATAAKHYQVAAGRATNLAEQQYLTMQAAKASAKAAEAAARVSDGPPAGNG